MRKAPAGNKSTSNRRTDPALVVIVLAGIGIYVLWRRVRSGVRLPVHGFLPPLALPLMVAAALAVTGLVTVIAVYRWRRRLARRVMDALVQLDVMNPAGERPRLRKVKREGCHGWHLALTAPVGIDSFVFVRLKNVLEEHLQASVRVEFDGQRIWLHLGTRRLPQQVGFEAFRSEAKRVGELPIGIGVSREGPLVVDLVKVTHLLVGGTTGGGKSVFLRQGFAGLVLDRTPAQVQLALADLKGGMEFNSFRGIPHLFGPVARDPASFLQMMEMVYRELARRINLLEQAGVDNLRAWNEQHPDQQLPYLIVCVDELAELTAKTSSQRDDGLRQASVGAMSHVARLGRAPGVFLILCTQRSDAEVVPGQIRSNIDIAIAFRAADVIHSQILLGQGNVAAALLPEAVPGRAVWKGSKGNMTLQVPVLEKRDAERLLAHLTSSGPPPAPWPSAGRDRTPNDGREASLVWPPRTPIGKSFNVNRLKPGNRYQFELRDGSTVSGLLRRLEYPTGLGGENRDGRHTVQVTDGSTAVFLDPRDVVSVRRC